MTRRWIAALPIRVASDEMGTPLWLVLRGRRYAVEEVATRWRVRQRWWRQPVWREYFVVVHGTLLLTIYHELPAGAWYLQAQFD